MDLDRERREAFPEKHRAARPSQNATDNDFEPKRASSFSGNASRLDRHAEM
jgi:hypothetical protein